MTEPNVTQSLNNLKHSDDVIGFGAPDQFDQVTQVLDMYVTPVIIVTGILANTVSCLVFLGTHLRRQSSSIYLASLAIVDSGYLVSLFVGWCGLMEYQSISHYQRGFCQVVLFLGFICSFLSVYYVVGFSFERWIVICHPFKTQTYCSVRRAKLLVVGLAALAVVVYHFPLWSSGVRLLQDTYLCMPMEGFERLFNIMINVDAIIKCLIPCIVIITLNACTGFKIYKVITDRNSRNQMALLAQSTSVMSSHVTTHDRPPQTHYKAPVRRNKTYFRRPVSGVTDGEGDESLLTTHVTSRRRSTTPHGDGFCELQMTRSRMRGRSQLKTTRFLLLVSTVFVILNVPRSVCEVYRTMQNLLNMDNNPQSGLSERIIYVCSFIYHLQFSINFFLYSLCARRFRSAFRRLLHKFHYKLRRLWRPCRGSGARRVSSPPPGRHSSVAPPDSSDRRQSAPAEPPAAARMLIMRETHSLGPLTDRTSGRHGYAVRLTRHRSSSSNLESIHETVRSAPHVCYRSHDL